MKIVLSAAVIVAASCIAPAWAGQNMLLETPVDKQTLTGNLESFIPGAEYNVALLCFKTGERVDGMNKICYYDCAGSAAAITVRSHELCPISISN